VLNADDPLVARMGRHCRGRVVYFSMATRKGQDGFDRVDGHCGRGGAAMLLQAAKDGELVVLRHGSRVMPLLYTHLMPATFGGRARMNVANALAAAAAAYAAGAHLHDIRQGLRTFTTSFFQAPGRLNLMEVNGFKVVIDYCHNVDGMRRLAEFVDLTMNDGERPVTARRTSADGNGRAQRSGRAIGVIGMPGDRRDEDHRAYGALAAQAFDVVHVREDARLRGRNPGEAAANVVAGVREAQAKGARCHEVDAVLNELDAARTAIRQARPGDLVVVCADDAAAVYREAMELSRSRDRYTAIGAPGEFEVPEG
jgi:cyanophycin synthetase